MGSKCRKQEELPPCDRAYELHKCLKLSNPEVIFKVLLKKCLLIYKYLLWAVLFYIVVDIHDLKIMLSIYEELYISIHDAELTWKTE